MKTKFWKFKKIICLATAFALSLTVVSSVNSNSASSTVYAAQDTVEVLTLSDSQITVTEGNTAAFTAAMPDGYDGSRLTCVVADANVAAVAPIAYDSNIATFAVNYVNDGSTIAAIINLDNPEIVAYITINATKIILNIPSKFGTNHNNYCTLVSYEFVPYDFIYANLNDYKYTLNLKYQCSAYNDTDFNKWGCYGYFYDAAGNVISKVHLYASSLSKGRVYHSEFNVPVNAVSFSIEGF
jgi:hypothetical protein